MDSEASLPLARRAGQQRNVFGFHLWEQARVEVAEGHGEEVETEERRDQERKLTCGSARERRKACERKKKSVLVTL